MKLVEKFEFKIDPSELFPNGLYIETIPWVNGIFNITKVYSVKRPTEEEPLGGEKVYVQLKFLSREQQDFIRDNLAKHYIQHRKNMLCTEGYFKLEEDVTKYFLKGD